ncbi:hypothetical protein C8E03_11428 [Lachnotalea glycerini]|uniref:Uncharacterized protein n=1 Tax=Lachnotalea glycerini TaxID=1763509 RepID=A0A255IMG1_9FIRM|nr:hypothetical protein [Lachnotalea glycerini]PXV85951.1 hypothetical protein C8E03_11428 [Lachnotalea glycerini]RDY31387.1 hypothetical protein CG710_009710 [Lachnotalea glycerini]
MAHRIPSKWSYIIKYLGGHPNITKESDAILRFTKKRVEIESIYRGKIALEYKDCDLEIQSALESKRIVIIYKNSFESESRIFIQIKKEKEENVVEVFHIYQKLALGSEENITEDSERFFKLFK